MPQFARQHRNVATAFFAARMIYNDGLNVMLAFGGVYAAGVFHWGETESALYGIVLSVFADLGGFLGGRSRRDAASEPDARCNLSCHR